VPHPRFRSQAWLPPRGQHHSRRPEAVEVAIVDRALNLHPRSPRPPPSASTWSAFSASR